MKLGLTYGGGGDRVILPEGWYKARLCHIEVTDRQAYQSEEREKVLRFQFELVEDVPDIDNPKSAYLVKDVLPKVTKPKAQMESGLVKLARALSFPKEFNHEALSADLSAMEAYVMSLVGNLYEINIRPNEKGNWNKLVSFKAVSKPAPPTEDELKTGFEDMPDAPKDDFGLDEII